jgi:type IV pilus assembly protein PilX
MKTHPHIAPQPPRSQRGAILVTSLLLLLVLTVLGITMMKMTGMQERMAGSTRDISLALQGAEAALREGEARLMASPAPPTTSGIAGCTFCEAGILPIAIDDPAQFDWDANASAQAYGTFGSTAIPGLAIPPRYTMEQIRFVDDDSLEGHDLPEGRFFYQVNARSTGATGRANVILQSSLARR